jgi:hypothetical protein
MDDREGRPREVAETAVKQRGELCSPELPGIRRRLDFDAARFRAFLQPQHQFEHAVAAGINVRTADIETPPFFSRPARSPAGMRTATALSSRSNRF